MSQSKHQFTNGASTKCDRTRVTVDYYFPEMAFSTAAVTSCVSGFTDALKRVMISPSRPITNFAKFQSIGPGTGESLPVKAAYNGCCSGPFTCNFSNSGKVTL